MGRSEGKNCLKEILLGKSKVNIDNSNPKPEESLISNSQKIEERLLFF